MESLRKKLSVGKNILFKPKEIMDISVKIVQEAVNKGNKNSGGNFGKVEDPHKIQQDWLPFVASLMEGRGMSYFSVNGYTMRFNHENRYVSEWSNINYQLSDEQYADIIKNGKIISENEKNEKITCAFISYFIGEKKLKNILDSKNATQKKLIFSQLVEFIYKCYFSIGACDSYSLQHEENSCLLVFKKTEEEITKNYKNDKDILKAMVDEQNSGKEVYKDVEKTESLVFPFPTNKKNAEEIINKLKASKFSVFTTSSNKNKGPSYPKIHEYISTSIRWMSIWYELTGNKSAFNDINIELTTNMRRILCSKIIKFDNINIKTLFSECLGIIVGTIFISETSRNPLSFLSGLIMMDLIEFYHKAEKEFSSRESKAEKEFSSRESSYFRKEIMKFTSHFSWENVFWSKKGKFYEDIYGKRIDSSQWGGIYPMAHKGSFTDEFGVGKEERDKNKNQFQINNPLSITRQKEADLIIRWLEIQFQYNKNFKFDEKNDSKEKIISTLLTQRIQNMNFQLDFVKDFVADQYKIFPITRVHFFSANSKINKIEEIFYDEIKEKNLCTFDISINYNN